MKALRIPETSLVIRSSPVLLPLLIGFLAAGCRVVQDTADLPGKTVTLVTQAGKPKPASIDPVEVQQTVLRCASEFSTGIMVTVDKLRRGTNALDPAEALRWKITLDSETTAIASGPNAFANLLDLTVLVTVMRATLEEHWMPNDFGDSAQAMLESCRSVETDLWLNTAKLLTEPQQAELRKAIKLWRRQHPDPESVLAARAVGFTSQLALNSKSDTTNPASVFNLLMLDPLAGMDPAIREIAQSRILAERALFVAQQMPRLLRWQTELLSLNLTRLPAVEQFMTNTAQFAASAEKFAGLADQLPQLVDQQRTAAIEQLFDRIAVERTNLLSNLAADDLQLGPRLAELRQTLDAGNALMKSSQAAIESLDKFMVRFDRGTNEPAPLVNTNARPFDILDYAVTAKQVTETLKELNESVQSIDATLPQIQRAGARIESAGNRLLARLFLTGAGLIVLLLVGSFFVGRALRRSRGQSLPIEKLNRSSF